MAAAPWLIGGVPVKFQLWLAYGVSLSLAFWIAGRLCRSHQEIESSIVLPLPLLFLVLLAVLGAFQLLIPVPDRPVSSSWAVLLEDASSSTNQEILLPNSGRVASVFPDSTKFQIARILIVVAAGFLGAQLFRTPVHFLALLGILAVIGATLALFGIGQKLVVANRHLETLPLQLGGGPFATFVNRNNAAGFLNICLAASLGGIILATGRRLRELSPSLVIIFATLSALIMAGIVASGSRGGMVATAAGLLVIAPWYYRQFGKWSLAGTIGVGASVISLATWLHFAEAAMGRLDTLKDLPDALSGRWRHWADTAIAFTDRPWLGSGWGTYRYVNLPYQQHGSRAWFWNADNQFFELAIEGGGTGILIVVGFLAATVAALVWIARNDNQSWTRSLVTSGVFLLVSLCVQETTDFGITLMSLALAGSVLIGAICGAGMRLRFDEQTFSLPIRFGASRTVVVSATLLLLLGTSWAGMAMVQAQPARSVCEQIPYLLNEPDLLPAERLDHLIRESQEALRHSPENAELHFDLARLLIYRLQQDSMNEVALSSSAKQRTQVWMRSQPEVLFDRSRLEFDSTWLDQLQNQAAFLNNVPDAIDHLQTAQAVTPWLPGVGLRLMLLETLTHPSDTSGTSSSSASSKMLLCREALLAAGNSDRLVNLGRIALKADFDDFAILCWRRALSQDESLLSDIVRNARLGFEDDQIVLRLLSTPQQLIAFAFMTHDLAAQVALQQQLEICKHDLDTSHGRSTQGESAWISAHIALLAGEKTLAIDCLRSAVECQPFQIEWRVELAEQLIGIQDYQGAREHLAFASRLEPGNENLKRRLKAVIDQGLRQRPAAAIRSHIIPFFPRQPVCTDCGQSPSSVSKPLCFAEFQNHCDMEIILRNVNCALGNLSRRHLNKLAFVPHRDPKSKILGNGRPTAILTDNLLSAGNDVLPQEQS